MSVASSQTMLKLLAMDRVGLAVISAHMQDSCVRPNEIVWAAAQGRFAIGAMRYDWAGAKQGVQERIGAALRFDQVTRVSQIGMKPGASDAMHHLLGITFEKTEAPAGIIIIGFADGGLIRLDVACLEVALIDLGPRIKAQDCAGHALTRAEAI